MKKLVPIAQQDDGIILAKYEFNKSNKTNYQSEKELEEQLIKDLIKQGYEYKKINYTTLPSLSDSIKQLKLNDLKVSEIKYFYDPLFVNLREKIEQLNNVKFTNNEWRRLLLNYIDEPNDSFVEKAKKLHNDGEYKNVAYDFEFDNKDIKNIIIFDKKNINNNQLQVINQIEVKGKQKNIYDVTILVNGLPLVHIELKKRAEKIKEAFSQIERYKKESFYEKKSLYKWVQIFVISNGTETRYFANTKSNIKTNYQYTIHWADAKNNVIYDLEDFTLTFLVKRTILEILSKYCVFDCKDELLIMRPYQIAATERILQKIKIGFELKQQDGGYIWHTTGSGKTLTSFKTARLATNLNFVDKVFFVVDRKDLDDQTIREYERFSSGSVDHSISTEKLKQNIEKNSDKIIVTTIQKLYRFIKKYPNHPIFKKVCVMIFDECHRTQFGETQSTIRRKFTKSFRFGFTGTPIFENNSDIEITTEQIFGKVLHSYVITHAIRDKKVLKFKIDYINDTFYTEDILKHAENNDRTIIQTKRDLLMHPNRITKVTKHILETYNIKCHRSKFYSHNGKNLNGFNAIFAVSSTDAARLYYDEFYKQMQKLNPEDRIKVATIFSYEINEDVENFDTSHTNKIEKESTETQKEFLQRAISDYNKIFKTNYAIEDAGQNYYRNVSERLKNKEIDLLIVVRMFLTGFDSPTLNTLYVDQDLRYHSLIQAFSRTNRILNSVKESGNIVSFRDLRKNTAEAIVLFGDDKKAQNIVLERSYEQIKYEYDNVVSEIIINHCTNKTISDLYNYDDIQKKSFIELFNKLLKLKNILRNFVEFHKAESLLTPRQLQDLQSVYNTINDEVRAYLKKPIIWEDIEFETEIIESEDINLLYIYEKIMEDIVSFDQINFDNLVDKLNSLFNSSIALKPKKDLFLEFVKHEDFINAIKNKTIAEEFAKFAKKKLNVEIEQLIKSENLKEDKIRNFIIQSVRNGHVKETGTELGDCIIASRMNNQRQDIKDRLIKEIVRLVAIYEQI